MRIKESGRLVEWTEEKNYMFKLSSFHERIEQWINDKKPLYPIKYNKLALIQLNELKKQGDISISREGKRLSWGIPVSFKSYILFIQFNYRYQMIHHK
jgi:methionyl-tRNA synthetase